MSQTEACSHWAGSEMVGFRWAECCHSRRGASRHNVLELLVRVGPSALFPDAARRATIQFSEEITVQR